MTIYLVRHAEAGDRERWRQPDHLRPLTEGGRRQASVLVGLLDGAPVSRILSSPYVRCVQTVEPLAAVRTLPVETTEDLAEGAGLHPTLELVRSLGGAHAVLCSHGDVIQETLEELEARGVPLQGGLRLEKGSTWELSVRDGAVSAGRYLPPPVVGAREPLPQDPG